ncbi:MAG: glycosyl hydrolase [Solirubrobacteraceae bacterium]|nr:glycosyl hydrolase [Patulibacter sp.]
MQRLRTFLLPLIALIALGTVTSTAAAKSSIKVGIGDQNAAMFDDPNYKPLGLKQTRYFFPWNGMKDPATVAAADTYLAKAKAAGVQVLFHLSTDNYTLKKAKLPSTAAYTTQVKKIVAHFRPEGVSAWGVWNEANHASEPTYKSPKAAADFFKAMYGVVKGKEPIVALDVLDQAGVDTYEKKFFAALSSTYKKRVKVVGFHNYGDVNRNRTTYTSKIIKAAKAGNKSVKFWITETGGLVEFGSNFKCSTARAATSTKHVFSTAKKFQSQGVQRLYLYNWFGAGCGNTRQDAGLVDPHGTPRPALTVVKQQLPNFSK